MTDRTPTRPKRWHEKLAEAIKHIEALPVDYIGTIHVIRIGFEIRIKYTPGDYTARAIVLFDEVDKFNTNLFIPQLILLKNQIDKVQDARKNDTEGKDQREARENSQGRRAQTEN